MDTKNEIERHALFEKVWSENLLPELEGLKGERKKTKQNIFLSILIALIFFGSIAVLPQITSPILLFSALVVGGLIIWRLYRFIKNNKSKYTQLYKSKIFEKILRHTNLDWVYVRPGRSRFTLKIIDIERYKEDAPYIELFEKSRLYTVYSDVRPDDVFYTIKNTSKIIASDMVAVQIIISPKGERHEVTVFAGLFVSIELKKPFNGETYILTNNDFVNVSGGHNIPFSDNNIEEVDLEWNDFEQFLRVRTNNQREAREIFTPDFMAVLHDWWMVHKKNIRLSFKGSNIYIAIPSDLDFEGSAFRSLEKEKQILQEHLELFWFIEEIVDILKKHNNISTNF